MKNLTGRLLWLLLLTAVSACGRPAAPPASPAAASPMPPAEPAALAAAAPFHAFPANPGAAAQIAALRSAGQAEDAELIARMVAEPAALWFTQGAPSQVQTAVAAAVAEAARAGKLPVLVAYNIPFRDCAQFSAGGATTTAAYTAWIDAFAAGLGDNPALVILEPDGLGIIPWYKPLRGTPAAADYEWCRPAEANEAVAAAERLAMLNYAVDALKARPGARVYLDGTHSAWLPAADAAHRLLQAGVQRADGFFLNVSNYETTERQVKYGRWISDCIYLAGRDALEISDCAGQYAPANPADFATWARTDAFYDEAFAAAGMVRDPAAQPHFVIDTSRNGQGAWSPGATYSDAQTWCNPPGRGLGLRPSAATSDPLVDAYLWVKIPGESDGECTRGGGPAGQAADPEWGRVDPPAGEWFPEMALELARNAAPPLAP